MGRRAQATDPAPAPVAAAPTPGGQSPAPALARRGQDWRGPVVTASPTGLLSRSEPVGCVTRRAGAQYPCVKVTVSQPLASPRPGPPLRHRSGRDDRRAVPPGPVRAPAAVRVEPCVGQHEALAHDADHRDLPRRSLHDELTVLRSQVRVVTDRRQGQAYGAAAAPAPGRPG